MKKILINKLSLYHSYHSQPITRIMHTIAIPLLVFAALIFLGWIHISVPNLLNVNLAWIGMMVLVIYYVWLDALLAIGMAVILIIMTVIADFISQPQIAFTAAIIFFVALLSSTVLIITGYLLEKKKPDLSECLSQLLIAPLYLFLEVLFKFGFYSDLQAEILKSSNL